MSPLNKRLPTIWPDIDLILDQNDIHIWLFEIPDPVDDQALNLCRAILSDEELSQYAEKDFTSQHKRVLTRAFLRHVLAQYLDCVCASDIVLKYNQYGKPSIDRPSSNLRFNLSHSQRWVCVALTLNRSIGVDIEVVKPQRNATAIAQHYLHKSEQDYLSSVPTTARTREFHSIWTVKEALVKALGVGLAKSFDRFGVIDGFDAPTTLRLTPAIELNDKQWIVRHCWQHQNLSLAVAVDGAPEFVPNILCNTISTNL